MLRRVRPLRVSRWGVAVPAVFALAGLIATASAQTARGTDLRSEGRTSTADLVLAQQRRAQVQEARVAQLRQDVERLSRQGSPAGSQIDAIDAKTRSLTLAAGLTPVTGQAIRVELDDARTGGKVPDGFVPDDLVVHQQDVQAVVNALWASGAEAMMLMDQRVISTSAVRCVGNVLILQDRVYSPPYRITAIGDPAAMQRALDQSQAVRTYREYVDAAGLGYRVERLGNRTLPAYDGALLLPRSRVLR